MIIGLLIFSNNSYTQNPDRVRFTQIADTLQSFLKKKAFVTGKIRVDSVSIWGSTLKIYFNSPLSEYPIREESANHIRTLVKSMVPFEYQNLDIAIISNGSYLEDFIPPLYKERSTVKTGRAARLARRDADRAKILVTNNSKAFNITEGLYGRHLAVWQSHGYYYEQKLLRWEWQRARIFQTVEDLYTQSYVVPFLVPMLENAGANVLLPRERDTQIHEIIVDNDISMTGYSEFSGQESWMTSGIPGFSNPKEYYLTGENPFTMGTARVCESIKKGVESYIKWSPDIPESGEYAVYVSYQSYPNSTESAQYTVYHAGGETKFTVNQKMGGSTWIYLGTFRFNKGRDSGNHLAISNLTGKKGEIVSADAVKFGGGAGNIARQPAERGSELNRKSSSTEPIEIVDLGYKADAEISNYPRFTEGARYWLQWAGFSDTIYSPNKNANDYNDDYMSRGRWVNVITGGSAKNPKVNGYNIPVDLALAFHTDAGTTLNDSIVGTLGIYTRFSNESETYPDGSPRFDSRHLTDIIQTQIVDDIRSLYEPIWQRRGIWDRSYSESRSPVVPTMLLELLSHQNFADMRYGLDPDFRFNVSRSIYKGMLRFLSQQSGLPYTVQPLPVNRLFSSLQGDTLKLSWSAVYDYLEPTATPEKYIVYTRIDGNGFDNGTLVEREEFSMNLERGKIYSFRVTAVNKGGESFPSEIISVYKAPFEIGKVLIINAFDRISAPASFASKDTAFAGFSDYKDFGVPYINDISYIGSQYEFRREIPWMDDDSPGFGASYSDFETKVIAGNSFDYPYIHGKAFAKAGYSFISISRDALINNPVNLSEFSITDVILGKQIKTKIGRGVNEGRFETFPPHLQKFLTDYAESGGNILVSGAHIATDLWDNFDSCNLTRDFAKRVLKYEWRTNSASRTAEVKAAQSPYHFTGRYSFFNTPNEKVYSAESPDGIEPVGKDAWTIFRYADNNISAGVAFSGEYKIVTLGFPIETLRDESQIDSIIEAIINFYKEIQ